MLNNITVVFSFRVDEAAVKMIEKFGKATSNPVNLSCVCYETDFVDNWKHRLVADSGLFYIKQCAINKRLTYYKQIYPLQTIRLIVFLLLISIIVMRERGAFSRHELENCKNIKLGRVSLFVQNVVKLEFKLLVGK